MLEDTGIEIEHKSLGEKVFEYIKMMILSGRLKGGERIPEGVIAKKFGASRTPIREAIKRLSEYGLVAIVPRSFALVAELDWREVEEIALIRSQLECLAVKLLANKCTLQDYEFLKRLSTECLSLISTGDLSHVFEKDSQLHLEIARRSGNQNLYKILENLDAKIQLVRLRICVDPLEVAKDIQQHEEILNRIRDHDVAAAVLLMESHILNHYENLIANS